MKLTKSKIITSVLAATLLIGNASFAAEYEVPVTLMKAHEEAESMGAGALDPKARVVEEDGRSEIYISAHGINFLGMHGHLMRMRVFPSIGDWNSQDLVEAEVSEKTLAEGLDGTESEFPSVFKISRNTTREEQIGIKVNVDAMDQMMGGGDGSQNARLVFDYGNAVLIKGDDDNGSSNQPSDDTPDTPDTPDAPDTPDTPDSPVVPPEDETPVSDGYISGYKDGSFKPDNSMTRAEASKILAIAVAPDFDQEASYENDFSDVKAEAWYKNPIGYLSGEGFIKGKGNGIFAPDAPITRAEFVTMIVNIMGVDDNTETKMTDISGHWAEGKIKTAIAEGWIKGYEDNTFKPDNNINRAEAVQIINNVKGYKIDKEEIKANISSYKVPTDMTDAHWAYYAVITAMNEK